MNPGDLFIIDDGRELALTLLPAHDNGFVTTTIDGIIRGHFPDERRSFLMICGKRYPVQVAS